MPVSAADLQISIRQGGFDSAFAKLYPDVNAARCRYENLLERFSETFGKDRSVELFSAPGRTEIGGNHTDHQHGRVLAAAVNLDVIAAVSKNSDNVIRIHSEGFAPDAVDISDLTPLREEREKSASLIRGVAAALAERGYLVGGFDACTTSNVLKGSGLSSSAAFEVLVAHILSHLYNDGKVDAVTAAKVSQYAENEYFGKPSGLMDQTASSVGGFVAIDFADPKSPVITPVEFDFGSAGYHLCIVNTGGNHADLTGEYAAITAEMGSISAHFGKTVLRDVDEDAFYRSLPELRSLYGDRAVLRVMHFFDDNRRALLERDALKSGDFSEFLRLISESGRSSAMLLQNIYAGSHPDEQGLSLALALSARILGANGAYRVHGGGFGGTIQAFVPAGLLEDYKAALESVFGSGSCHVLQIRGAGGIAVRPC